MSIDPELPNIASVTALLDALVQSRTIVGASVLIHHGGEEALFHRAGVQDLQSEAPLTRDTLFQLFSMTKPVTAAAVMTLIDDGALRLDSAIAEHLPELASLHVRRGGDAASVRLEAARPITVEHLRTHTAGFSYWFYPDQPVAALYATDPVINDEQWRFDVGLGGAEGMVAALARLPLVGQPGERWHYGMSFDVAGVLVERVTGTSLEAVMRERIFSPLGMIDTGFFVPEAKADRLASLYKPLVGGGIERLERGSAAKVLQPTAGLSGGGGLVSTIDDYSRFARMLCGGGELEGRRVLSASSARAMATTRLAPRQLTELPGLAEWGLGGSGEGLGFGLGGAVVVTAPGDDVPATPGEYSWGGAGSTTFWIDPQRELTVVFMTQLQPPVGDLPRDRLHRSVYDRAR